MTIVRPRQSVDEFYRKALGDGADTAERLDAPVADRFAVFVNSLDHRVPRTALDLGYGMGIYTTTLARLGFHVTAVDQIPTDFLRRRLAALPQLSARIDVVQQHIEEFWAYGQFGIVVAKDVLHYIEQQQVLELLCRCAHGAPAGAGHYLEVFTDIERTDRDGNSVLIDGEAGYTADTFRAAIDDIYHGWSVRVTHTSHSEENTGHRPDRASPRKYFHANRVTVMAILPTGSGGQA